MFIPSAIARFNTGAVVRSSLRPWLLAAAFAPLGLGLFAPESALGQCPGQWLPGIGIPGTNYFVYSLAVHPDGDLFVGGQFTTAGGSTADRIARYHPTSPTTGTWSQAGEGVNGTVWTLAMMPDGDVIAGGEFFTASGVNSSNIARYHPTSPTTGAWSAMEWGVGGMGHHVYALAVLPDGDVIAGGGFITAGGVTANRIARFHPTSPTTGAWYSMGSGMNDVVRALTVLPSGDVIAGGAFTTAGGLPANRIARYHPTSLTTGTWSALEPGTSAMVSALAVMPDGDVVVGGEFTMVGAENMNRTARYHPTSPTTGTWSALGSGTTGAVYTLAMLPNGDVAVGGSFGRAGGLLVLNVARYHPTSPTTGTWSAFGSGTGNEVWDLAVLPDGDLVAGGVFGGTGTLEANHIARYTARADPVFTKQPSDVAACPGETVVISVAVSGVRETSYQWRHNGADLIDEPGRITGATTSVLSIYNTSGADAGAYVCSAVDACGSTTSEPGTVTVLSSPCAAVLFVNGAAPGGDGLSWETAFTTLDAALERARLDTQFRQIWIAEGTYSSAVETSFAVPCGVSLLGGFAGDESSPAERDWLLHPTVLSGGSWVAHVVLIEDCPASATLSGLTITGGRTPPFSEWGGAAVRLDHSVLTISDCLIAGNVAGVATSGGGGVYSFNSTLRLERCELTGNSTENGYDIYAPAASGGALASLNSHLSLVDCRFIGNSTGSGGNGYCVPNQTSLPGGDGGSGAAMNIAGGSTTIVNSLFAGNTVGLGGIGAGPCFGNGYRAPDGLPGRAGGIYTYNTALSVINCTFADNTGGAFGGQGSNLALSNSILWANGGDQQFAFYTGTPTVAYSCIQGWTGSIGGVGVIASDPAFVGTGDYSLRAVSPCLDAADNIAVPAEAVSDLAGNPRFVNIPSAPDTGVTGGRGGSAIVDMGAYEREGTCLADYNNDGGVDGSDIGAFFADWEAGVPGADVNGDGGTDGADVEFFFMSWELGC